MNKIQGTAVIRDRGQLTIPDKIRKSAAWATPLSAVSISIIKPDEIVIKPHGRHIDWEKILEGIKKARSIHGSGTKSALKFIQEDRLSH